MLPPALRRLPVILLSFLPLPRPSLASLVPLWMAVRRLDGILTLAPGSQRWRRALVKLSVQRLSPLTLSCQSCLRRPLASLVPAVRLPALVGGIARMALSRRHVLVQLTAWRPHFRRVVETPSGALVVR